MLEIVFRVVPGGLQELAYDVDRVTVACRFPLNPEAQDMHLIHRGEYASLAQFAPDDGPDCWLRLARAGLAALAEHPQRLTGLEVFPGALALDPAEFDDEMRRLVHTHGAVIHSVRLFGRRASGEDLSEAEFWRKVDTLPRRFDGRPDFNGDWLAANWPGYVPWDVCVRLARRCYETGPMEVEGVHYASLGHALEHTIRVNFGLRPMPADRADTPLMCGNDIRWTFERPRGELASPVTRDSFLADKWSTTGQPRADKPDPKFRGELQRAVRAGRLVYDAPGGLRLGAGGQLEPPAETKTRQEGQEGA